MVSSSLFAFAADGRNGVRVIHSFASKHAELR